MSRKDFISDHLVDMRAQLRDSYTSYHQNKAAREAAAQHSADAADETVEKRPAMAEKHPDPVEKHAPVKTSHPAEKYLPSMRVANDRSGDVRERRELEGRILHDLAAIDSEREKLHKKLDELEKFSAVLTASREQISDGDPGEIGRVYYSARGRWSAFEESGDSAARQTADVSFDSKGFWIVAVSVLTGSVIVAFSLIKAFSV